MRGPREGSSSLSKIRRNASATTNISNLATQSTPTSSEMSTIPILVHHNGEWDQSFNFTNYKMKGAILRDGCNFQGLVEILTKVLKINQTETTMEIRYQLKQGFQPIEIEDDDSLLFYLEMKKTDNDVTNLPLCVSTRQKQLQLIIHPSTSAAISSQRVASESSQRVAAISSQGVASESSESVASESSETVASESSETIVKKAAAVKETTTEKESVAEKPSIDAKLLEAISDIIEYGKILSKRVMEAENKEEEEEEEEDKNQQKVVISDTLHQEVEVGQLYKDKETLKCVLSFYAIRNNFQYKVIRSCGREYTLICFDRHCKWSLRAARKGPAGTFIIRRFNNLHTCSLDVRLDNRQATANVIGERIKEKFLFLDANNDYKPKDIVRDMKENYGISLSYQKAWRSREKALENLRGKASDSFKMLPSFMYMLTTTNPGSIVEIKTMDDCSFQYTFMAINACIQGWKNCRPVVVVEVTFLRETCGGALLTATAEDAGGKIFPLAFAIVNVENEDSWEWFFSQMRETFGAREDMCIISDLNQSIERASVKVFPEAWHRICMYHLLDDLKTKFEKSDSEIKDAFFKVARAYTVEEFGYHMSEVEKIDRSIPLYLQEVGYHKWARAHCVSNRCKIMTSKLVESLNITKKEAKKLPITTLLSFLHGLVQERTSENRKIACQTSTVLTKKAEDMLNKNYLESLKIEVKQPEMELFSVLHNEKTYTVNLKDKSCTCNKFQIDEIPCSHAIAILRKLQQDWYEYCSEYHKRDTMVATYESMVFPIPNHHSWDIPDEIKQIVVLPPKVEVRNVGRPKKRKATADADADAAVWKSKKQNKCRKCEQKGHNRKTCPNLLNAK